MVRASQPLLVSRVPRAALPAAAACADVEPCRAATRRARGRRRMLLLRQLIVAKRSRAGRRSRFAFCGCGLPCCVAGCLRRLQPFAQPVIDRWRLYQSVYQSMRCTKPPPRPAMARRRLKSMQLFHRTPHDVVPRQSLTRHDKASQRAWTGTRLSRMRPWPCEQLALRSGFGLKRALRALFKVIRRVSEADKRRCRAYPLSRSDSGLRVRAVGLALGGAAVRLPPALGRPAHARRRGRRRLDPGRR